MLDPFAGSGTTNVVAKELGRNSLGVEVQGDYCVDARNALKKAKGARRGEPTLYDEVAS